MSEERMPYFSKVMSSRAFFREPRPP